MYQNVWNMILNLLQNDDKNNLSQEEIDSILEYQACYSEYMLDWIFENYGTVATSVSSLSSSTKTHVNISLFLSQY